MIKLEEIDSLARLARLELTKQEKNVLRVEIEKILDYVSELKEAPPVGDLAVTSAITNVLRSDQLGTDAPPTASVPELLPVAGRRRDDYLVVKEVFSNDDN